MSPLLRTRIYQSQIFDNEVDLNGCTYGMYFINYNDAQNRVYNNWFYGAVGTYALNMGASNYNNHVHNNTFVCQISNTNGAAIYSQGYTSANRANEFYDNIVWVIGAGACFRQYPSTTNLWPFTADGNLYWAPAGAIGIDNTNTRHTTLASWQTATGQDTNSRNLPAGVVSITDLRLTATSAAIDAAINLPTWLTVDHDGEARGAKGDVGADEVVARSFGTGCPGTNARVPEQTSTGFWKPLTASFQCVLGKAPPSTVGVLVLGFSDKQWGPFTLPLGLPNNCTLYTSFDFITGGATSGSGDLAVPLSLPDLPIVHGLRLFTQFLVADPASPFGWTLSNALSLDS